MRTSVPIGASILFLSITASALAADDPLMKQAQGLFQPIPPQPPAIKDVPSTPAMVELGKDLYSLIGVRPRATILAATLAIRLGLAAWTCCPCRSGTNGKRVGGTRPRC